VGLDAVMMSAERGEVAGVCLTEGTALVEVDVGLDVVEVAAARSSVATGEHTDRVTESHQLGHPRRWVMPVDSVGARHVQHRLELDRGVGEPRAQHVEEHRPGRRATLDVEDDGACRRSGGETVELVGVQMEEQSRGRGGPTGSVTREQVERALRVGEDADGAGAAYVEGVVVTQPAQGGGTSADSSVERLGVVGVEPHVDVGGQRGRAVQQLDLPGRECLELVVEGAVGIVVQPGLVDQALRTHLTDARGIRCDQPVGVGSGDEGEVASVTGDVAGEVDRDPPGDDMGEEPRQPVLQLEAVTHELLDGLGGPPELDGELDRRELGDRWRPLSGQGDHALAEDIRLAPLGTQPTDRGGVGLRPLDRGQEEIDVRGATPDHRIDGPSEHRGGAPLGRSRRGDTHTCIGSETTDSLRPEPGFSTEPGAPFSPDGDSRAVTTEHDETMRSVVAMSAPDLKAAGSRKRRHSFKCVTPTGMVHVTDVLLRLPGGTDPTAGTPHGHSIGEGRGRRRTISSDRRGA
jgi:hypothetical protein